MAENEILLRSAWRLRVPLHAWLRLKFGYRSGVYSPAGPFLLVCNHVTDWDPILIASSFRTPMHFVASEHIFRWGFLSRLIVAIASPIARQKGGNAAGTVRAMLRRLQEGCNVAIFPEGNRTWDGRTAAFLPSIGKVARISGAALVTYRLSGLYLSSPRWAGTSLRKGRSRGEIVHVYSPEELKAMTPAEINAHITEDLAVDALAAQRSAPVAYHGRDLAVGLESLLFSCPCCGALHHMKSEGSRFFCTACGANSEFTPEGFFLGDFPYDNVADWNTAQKERIRSLCSQASDEPIFSDSGLTLSKVASARGSQQLAEGTLTLYKDRLELPGGLVLPLSEISGVSVMKNAVLFIGTRSGDTYELRACQITCVVKYLTACTCLGCPTEYGV